jgi:ParB/RepB/Spo0J family partition protein
MTTETTSTFQVLKLAQLHESPLNPRRHFDPAKLQELTESVRQHGVRTPLLVRPNGDGYEIGAGHRRFRAAAAAGLVEVPAVIRPMTDVEFLELLNFENLEREDIHPLEEADGFRTLMAQAGYDVARIAERIGKSTKYVYDRVKLLALIPAAQQLFRDGAITAGHAILLARLKPADQARPAILEAMAAAVKKAPTKATGLLADIVVRECEGRAWSRPKDVGSHVPRGTTAEDLVRHAAFLVLASELHEWTAPRDFPQAREGLQRRRRQDPRRGGAGAEGRGLGEGRGQGGEEGGHEEEGGEVAVARAAGNAPALRRGESACVICGCTDSAACPRGCGWAMVDRARRRGVCTTCVRAALARLDRSKTSA